MIDESKRYVGKVIHVDKKKGYGFITCPDIRFRRVFFHWQGLRPGVDLEKLEKDARVEFNARDYGVDGIRAVKVEVINDNVESVKEQ